MIVGTSVVLPTYGQSFTENILAASKFTETLALDNGTSENRIDGFLVKLDQQELFVIQAEIGSFSPQERAQVITSRIQALAADPSIDLNDITIEQDEASTTAIVLGSKVLITVTEADAKAARRDRQYLAIQYRKILKSAIQDYHDARSTKALGTGGIYAAIATITLVACLALVRIIFPRIRDWLCSLRGTQIPNVRIQNFELLSANRTASVLVEIAKIIRWGVIIGLLYTYLTFVLSCFPWTQPFGENLISYLLAAIAPIYQSILGYLPNLAIIILIGFITYHLIRILKAILRAIEQGHIAISGFHQEWIEPTYKLLLFLIIVLAIVIIFPYLPGAESPAFRGISIVLGVIFSLGSTAAVANMVSGIILVYTRAFELGDRVKIGDNTGTVEEKTLLVIQIRTPKNALVTIPNSAVLNSNVINFSASIRQTGTPLIVNTTLTLGYDVPWRQVHTVLMTAAQKTIHILPDPAPFVLQTSLDDFYVSYELNAYTQQPTQMSEIYSELHQNIQDHCNAAGIEILSPHYSAVRDGHQITIPETYLDKDYVAPSFRLQLFNALFPSHQLNQKPRNWSTGNGERR